MQHEPILTPFEKITKAARPLVEDLYMINVKQRDSISVEEMRLCGVYSTGNKDIDKAIGCDNVTRCVNIMTMVEYYKQNIPFAVVRYDETKIIYEYVHDYLQICKESLISTLNIVSLDVELLIALDRFASKVYDHAMVHFDDEFISSKLMRNLSNMGATLLNARKVPEIKQEDQPIKRYQSNLPEVLQSLSGLNTKDLFKKQ